MRTVVIGASSGLGRSIGVHLGQQGHQVALLARRRDRLDVATKEAGNGSFAVECDATHPASCQDAIEEATATLGGIDSLVYTPAIGRLVRLKDMDQALWREMFDINVIGAAVATAAALPHLSEANGRAIFLSTPGASMTAPWPGLSGYQVTKAALDKLVEAWRAEHPEVAFTRLVVGECGGGDGDSTSEFAEGWDPDLRGEVIPDWFTKGHLSGNLIAVEDLLDTVETVLTAGPSAAFPSVAVVPRPPLPAP